MTKKAFKDYNVRLNREAFIKSLICGLIIGFSALLVSATVFWLTAFNQTWLCAVIWAVATAGTTPIFYYKKFRPTVREMAKRIDKLGLEERMLTMAQFEGDNSYIAVRQREDALRALSTVNAKLIKFVVSVPLIITLAIVGVSGTGMVTVAALSAAGVLDSGKDIIEEVVLPEPEEYEISYDVKGAGMIEGDIFQIVVEGKNATAVMAVPDDEWVFLEWSDGSTDPYREDMNIQSDMNLIAIFSPTMDAFPGDGEGEEGDSDSEAPPEGEEGGKPGDDPGKGSTGGEWTPTNQVIDGETYYGGTTYDNAYEDVIAELTQNDEIPDDLKAIIDSYFQTIEQ